MQSNRKCSTRRAMFPHENQVGTDDVYDPCLASASSGAQPSGPGLSRPFRGIEFHPSEICPRNFIICDNTEDRSQVMFHPAVAHNLSYPPFNFNETPIRENTGGKMGNNVEIEIPPAYSEDSDEINALLSLDKTDEDQWEPESEEVSTARTQGCYDGSSSPDSCSNYIPKSRRVECPSGHKSSHVGSSYIEGKRTKVRKTVRVLRGMVPGGDQMDTVAVLDEAVKYLKSMKMEAQKLGLESD